MPFGAAGAPATQQRMADNLLAGMKWICALAYLDHVMVFSQTFEDHLKHLKQLFERARKGSLHVKPQQCRLYHPETNYLGFLVSAFGIRPDPAKVAALRDFPVPKDLKAVRGFLGIGCYYRSFIKNFACISKPLQGLTRGEIRFRERSAFETIKQAIVDVAALAYPQRGKGFTFDCDACAIGLGAVLFRKDDPGRERPIVFASRLLRSMRQSGTRRRLEAFAVVWDLETFRAYVEGPATLVRTDHSPLP